MNILLASFIIPIWFLFLLGKELIMRLISLILFPIAYSLRWKLRAYLYGRHKAFFEDRVWSMNGFTVPKPDLTITDYIVKSLWSWLDDSPAKDNITKVNPNSYDESLTWDSSDNVTGYPYAFLYNNRVLRDFWWAMIRNNRVNRFSYDREMGGWDMTVEPIVIIGKMDRSSKFNLLNIKHLDGQYYYYCTLNFGKINFNFGSASGSGRYTFG